LPDKFEGSSIACFNLKPLKREKVMENWVERRALRDQYLANSGSVWQSACAAIHNCCNSYRQHFAGIAHVTNKPDNGHRIAVGIHFHQVKFFCPGCQPFTSGGRHLQNISFPQARVKPQSYCGALTRILELRPHRRRKRILLYQFRIRQISRQCHPSHGHAKQISRFPIVEPERELVQVALQVL
jgi:hypothetical protein